MIIQPILAYPLSLFFLSVCFGFWVRRRGQPYHPVLFNIHKLTALTGVVLTILKVRAHLILDTQSDWMNAVLAGALFSVVMLFASGGVMSISKNEPGIALSFHRTGSVIVALCLVGGYFLL
jgi:hypothetical protein